MESREILNGLLEFMVKNNFLYLHLSFLEFNNKKLYNHNKEEYVNITPKEIKIFENIKYITQEEWNDFYHKENRIKEVIKKKKGKIIIRK